jgi:hypothetical protein
LHLRARARPGEYLNARAYLGGALPHADEAEVIGSAGLRKSALLYSDAIVAN